MNKRFIFLLLMLLPLWAAADDRWRLTKTNVIEDSLCIPKLNGEGYLHVDEDVSGLIISVIGADGAENFLFDVPTEIEDVAVPGTGAYTAPSANNVRVSPDGSIGGDCTEMQFADAVYSGEDWIQIRVTDGQTTIMDFTRWVYLDLITTQDLGLILGPLAITTVTDPTHLILPSGPSNVDALDNTWAFIEGDTEQCLRQIIDYAVGPPTVTLRAACPFTVTASTDTIAIHASASGDALQIAQVDLDTQTGSSGVILDANTVTSGALAASAVTKIWDDFYVETGTADSGSTTTLVDSLLSQANPDYWINTKVIFTSGTIQGQSRCIDSFIPSSDTLRWRKPLTAAVGVQTYVLAPAPECNNNYVQTGLADSGTVTSFVDAALTEADTNYWAKNLAVLFTSGSAQGQLFCITSFIPASDTVNFTPAATQAIALDDDYAFLAAPGCDPFR